MRYTFHIVDVFTASPFGGNQLAVLPEAAGISSEGMQKIAREFNFAETTFVLPPADAAKTRQVRIFTPKAEVDFAGHPTVGTACALVMRGHVDRALRTVILEEKVGPVAVEVTQQEAVFRGALTLTGRVDMPAGAPSRVKMAAVLSLHPEEVVQVFFAGVGLPFCFVELVSPEAVDRAAIDKAAWTRHMVAAWSPHIFFFAGEFRDGGRLHARMCAPALGIEEDPATGSASAALVAALALRRDVDGEHISLSIRQGVAMGRLSEIEATAVKRDGKVSSVSVAGATAYVASGEIEVSSSMLTG